MVELVYIVPVVLVVLVLKVVLQDPQPIMQAAVAVQVIILQVQFLEEMEAVVPQEDNKVHLLLVQLTLVVVVVEEIVGILLVLEQPGDQVLYF